MEQLTIGEVARRTGLQTSAIRYYERIGLLTRPTRVNGRRRYTVEVLHKIGVIQMARQAGFTIAEVEMLLHDFQIDTAPST
jgi:MerR family redox-sensitive transcriptional activator SoxR